MKRLITKSFVFLCFIMGFLSGYNVEISAQNSDPVLYHFDGLQIEKTNLVTQESERVAHSAPEFRLIFNVADEDSFIIRNARELIKTNSDFSEFREYSENVSIVSDRIFINSDYTKLIFKEFDGIKVYDIEADQKDLLFEPEADAFLIDDYAYHNGEVFYIERRTGNLIGLNRSDMDGNTELITDLDFNGDLYVGENGKAYIMGSNFNSDSIIRMDLDGSNMETVQYDFDLGTIRHFAPATSQLFYSSFIDGTTIMYKTNLAAAELEETELFDLGAAYSPDETIYNPDTNSIIYHIGFGIVYEYNMDTEVVSTVTDRMPDQKFTVDVENEHIYFTNEGKAIQTDLNYENWTQLYDINDGFGTLRFYFEHETENFYYYQSGDILYFNVHEEEPEPAILVGTDGNVAHDFVVSYNNNVAFIYSDNNGIYRIELDSGDTTLLADNARDFRAIAYSAEFNEVAYASMMSQSNLRIYGVSATGDDSHYSLRSLDGTVNTLQYVPEMGGYAYSERGWNNDYNLTFISAIDGDREILFNTDQINRFYLVGGGNTDTSTNPEPETITQVSLNQNYPNPFNPTTQISYDLPEAADVRLEVYNMLGQRIQVLVNGRVNAGNHTVNFDASRLSSGMYIYRLVAGDVIKNRTMMLVK
ncbi:MAG: T9SS type A sorting domain-containing protein [Balneolales bacterium]|nr:T9SS type A sorting domain-containing protein [Balneolales bacterium]